MNEIYRNIDFKATMAGLLGFQMRGETHGRDQSRYLKDPAQPAGNDVVCLDFFDGKDGQAHVIALNQGYWFAAVFERSEKGNNTGIARILLFDRQKDTHQLKNLHGDKNYLDLEKEMVARLRQELQRVNHPNTGDLELIEKALN